jgi:3-dehydroquinate dehydratase/shikimate dehydrogenase
VTLRLPVDGGKWQGPESQRRQLLRDAIAAGVEYVDLEETAAAQIPRVGATKRIVSYHNFDETADDLKAIHARLAAQDADIIKLATMARSTHDAFRMMDLARTSSVPTIALCMGDLGTPTRLLAGKFDAPLTYAAPDDGAAPAPGQVAFRAMRDIYRCEAVARATDVYGVIGDPIAHSKSPLIYNAAFEALGIDAIYIPFHVRADDVETFVDDSRRVGFRGLSVTIPHKEAAFECTTKGERAIGAVNTLVFDGDEIAGYNTDCSAAIASLQAGLSKREPNASLAGRTILLLGAGGAAKAIAYGLQSAKAHVVIASRTRARSEELASSWSLGVVDWDARHDVAAEIVVNCTPLGMSPRIDDSPFDAQYFRPGMIVFDTIYTPERTRFIREAEAAGCTVLTGVEMFVRQATRQFALVTGCEAPEDVMRAALQSSVY